MNVAAISTPPFVDWRWRIVNYAGDLIEESSATFASIASAVADGTLRMRARNDVDLSTASASVHRSTSHLRNR